MRVYSLLLSICFWGQCCTNTEPEPRSKPSGTTKPETEVLTLTGGSEMLFSSRWRLINLNGEAFEETDRSEIPFLAFYPGPVSMVKGSTGCNQLNGSFELSAGHAMKFAPLATTRKACPDGGSEFEIHFLSALQRTDHYSVSDVELLLVSDSTVIAKFKAE